MLNASVLSRVTLVITTRAGVIQANMQYTINAFVLPLERECAGCPVFENRYIC